MKTLDIKKTIKSLIWKSQLVSMVCICFFCFSLIAKHSTVSAQEVLFDFNNTPIHSPLPLIQTESGITAHFSATGQGYSIQEAGVLGFVPTGFSGNCIYPSSIYLADLIVSFDQRITDFNIMYSCQELGCDDAATMRATTYMKGSFVGTNTKSTNHPGTWPVDTLGCNFSQGFDSVVVHYDNRPPTCKDYGVIFMVDNMWVIPIISNSVINKKQAIEGLIVHNPVSQLATILFSLIQAQNIKVNVYDVTGKLVKNVFNGPLNTGKHQIEWNVNDEAIKEGIYFIKISGMNFSHSCKLVVLK